MRFSIPATFVVIAFLAGGCSGSSPVPLSTASRAVAPYAHLAPSAGWPSKRVLFVADTLHNQILMYDPSPVNPSPEGSITNGIDAPFGLAVDQAGTLYVSNYGNNSVTEYPAGQTSPSFTITKGLRGNDGVAVDLKGDVFVSNFHGNTVTEYLPGQNRVFQTIAFGHGREPAALAVDDGNNLYVASPNANSVYVVPAGMSTPLNLNLKGLSGLSGVSVGRFGLANEALYVASFNRNQVGVYPRGQTSPAYTITKGMDHPGVNALVGPALLFQCDDPSGIIVGYRRGHLHSVIDVFARGVAGYPSGL